MAAGRGEAAAHETRHALRQGLVRLAASRPLAPEGRRLRAFGRRSRLGALLEEIDATVLPQRLILADAGGREWYLDVAARRLTRIGRADAAGPGVMLDTLGEADLRPLGDALRAALYGPAEPCLRPDMAPGTEQPGGRGLPVATLRSLWDEAQAAPIPTTPDGIVAEAADAFGPAVRAWITGTARGVEGDGADPWLGALEDTVLALGLADWEGQSTGAGPLELDTVLALPEEDGASAVVMTLRDGFAALMVDPADADALAGRLQAGLHGWA